MKASKHIALTGAPKKKGNIRHIAPWPLILPLRTPAQQRAYKQAQKIEFPKAR